MSKKFFTNREQNTLFQKFKGIFDNNKIDCFDTLIGYFRASGYFQFRTLLQENVPQIRILVGINTDQTIANAQQKSIQLTLDYQNQPQNQTAFWEAVRKDISTAAYNKETEDSILLFFKDVVEGKLQIKACKNTVHSKIYIFRPLQFNEHTNNAAVITGSSNFTQAGLGLGSVFNYEFNVILRDYDEVKFATDEFETLWADATDILPVDNQSFSKQQFIQKIQNQTHLSNQITPFEIYIKLLQEYFGSVLNESSDFLDEMKNFKKLSYQVDAVNEGFNMLIKHNGFILADVVGLGKTVIATMIAKKFTIRNGKDKTRLLVICPPAVEKNWRDTFTNFNIDTITSFVTNGSLDKVLDRSHKNKTQFNTEDYDLVIVDEAHNFRNITTKRFNDLQQICKNPRKNNNDGIKGTKKKIILVSATPLNNRPDDIFALLQLFQNTNQSTLPVPNLTRFFDPLIKQYNNIRKHKELTDSHLAELRHIYELIRKNTIEPITIRRTRTDISSVPEYAQDLQAQNIIFPTVLPPKQLGYDMSPALAKLFYHTVENLTNGKLLKYARYQAIAALIPSQKANFQSAETISKSLASIMKTMLVKRLESSFNAFYTLLERFKTATQNMINMFDNGKIFIAPDLNVNDLLAEGKSYEDIENLVYKANLKGGNSHIFTPQDFQPTFINELNSDLDILTELCTSWQTYDHTQDPKLTAFLHLFKTNHFFNPIIDNPTGKLVIFTEAQDTAYYLAQHIQNHLQRQDILCISSKNRKDKFKTILDNFDANLPQHQQTHNYNIIITTEVLAEGVNLHRSNVIIHYDIPWNATKLMQRIGRVNRIGSVAANIYNFVFYPSPQGDEEIRLSKTAFIKLQGFHSALGEDNQIYSPDEILDPVKLFTAAALNEPANPLLKHFHFLRQYEKEHLNHYQQIQKLPLRTRVGRRITNLFTESATVAFFKTTRKFEFYHITDHQTTEITPAEALNIFEAHSVECPVDLIPNHYAHIEKATQQFYQTITPTIVPQAQEIGETNQKAVNVLNDLKSTTYNPTQILTPQINAIIDHLTKGTYAQLAKEVNKIKTELKKNITPKINPTAIWQPLLETLINNKNYTFYSHTTTEQPLSVIPTNNDNFIPQLIISETFQ